MAITIEYDKIIASGYRDSLIGVVANQELRQRFRAHGIVTTGYANANSSGSGPFTASSVDTADPWADVIQLLPPLGIRPTRYPSATLQERQLDPIQQEQTQVTGTLIYRTPPVGGGAILFTLTDIPNTSIVETYETATGQNAFVWYKAGTDKSITTMPDNSTQKYPRDTKIIVNSTLRATGYATAQAWYAIRDDILAAEGTINSDTWGNATRGTYLFIGPAISTIDKGASFQIQLDFLRNRFGWYSLDYYLDAFGNKPNDSACEQDVRGGSGSGFGSSLPSVGQQLTRNGISLTSRYMESVFSPLFGFTPNIVTSSSGSGS